MVFGGAYTTDSWTFQKAVRRLTEQSPRSRVKGWHAWMQPMSSTGYSGSVHRFSLVQPVVTTADNAIRKMRQCLAIDGPPAQTS